MTMRRECRAGTVAQGIANNSLRIYTEMGQNDRKWLTSRNNLLYSNISIFRLGALYCWA